MITVAILINGNPLMARSAVNKGEQADGKTKYKVDDGSIVYHHYDEGTVVLAQKLLDTLKEVK